MKQLPLPLLHDEALTKIQSLVASIVLKQKSNERYPYWLYEQKEIDAMVLELYGLNADDIREVELWFCWRYDRLAKAQGIRSDVELRYAAHLARCREIMAKLQEDPSYWASHPIRRLVAENEHQRLEFKERCSGVERDNLLKEIAAFRNTDGGTILLGVTDDARIVGMDAEMQEQTPDAFKLGLHQAIDSRITPAPMGAIKIALEPLTEGTVCRIDVPHYPGITFKSGQVFVRVGSESRPLQGQMLLDWSQGRRGNGG